MSPAAADRVIIWLRRYVAEMIALDRARDDPARSGAERQEAADAACTAENRLREVLIQTTAQPR